MQYTTIKTLEHKKWNKLSNVEFAGQPLSLQPSLTDDGTEYKIDISDKRLGELGAQIGADLTNKKFILGTVSPYDDVRFLVKLNDGTTSFNHSNPIEEVRAGIARAHTKYVASNKKEAEESNKRFYIEKEDEDDVEASKKLKLNEKAYELLKKLSVENKLNIIAILRAKKINAKDKDKINSEISSIIAKDLEEFILYAEKQDSELDVRACVVMAINKNFIVEDTHDKFFKFGDFKVGRNLEEAIEYFTVGTGKDLYEKLKTKIEAK